MVSKYEMGREQGDSAKPLWRKLYTLPEYAACAGEDCAPGVTTRTAAAATNPRQQQIHCCWGQQQRVGQQRHPPLLRNLNSRSRRSSGKAAADAALVAEAAQAAPELLPEPPPPTRLRLLLPLSPLLLSPRLRLLGFGSGCAWVTQLAHRVLCVAAAPLPSSSSRPAPLPSRLLGLAKVRKAKSDGGIPSVYDIM